MVQSHLRRARFRFQSVSPNMNTEQRVIRSCVELGWRSNPCSLDQVVRSHMLWSHFLKLRFSCLWEAANGWFLVIAGHA
eukprot:1947575-Amphidinium_carterae.1